MKRTIVIDSGGCETRCGFGDGDLVVFPTVCGRSKIICSIPPRPITELRSNVGDDMDHLSLVRLQYPISGGVVTNWDDMEQIWRHVFYSQLKVEPSEHPIILTEQVLNPRANRERAVQIMMEDFNVKHLFIANQSSLALFATGRTTGIVLDCGHDYYGCVAIYDGYPILPVGAATPRTWGFHTYADIITAGMEVLRGKDPWTDPLVRKIREKHCYVALDFEREKAVSQAKIIDSVKFNHELFEGPEWLFIGLARQPTIQETVWNCFESLNDAFKAEVPDLEVVINGGPTLMRGFPERLRQELGKMGLELGIVAHPSRKYLSWLGAQRLDAILRKDPSKWITQEEYDQVGPGIERGRCL